MMLMNIYSDFWVVIASTHWVLLPYLHIVVCTHAPFYYPLDLLNKLAQPHGVVLGNVWSAPLLTTISWNKKVCKLCAPCIFGTSGLFITMVRRGPVCALGKEWESQTSSSWEKKVYESLVSIQKNITKPLRRPARFQLRGGLGAVDVENGGHTTHRRSSWHRVQSCTFIQHWQGWMIGKRGMHKAS